MPHVALSRVLVITFVLIALAAIAVNANWGVGAGLSFFTVDEAVNRSQERSKASVVTMNTSLAGNYTVGSGGAYPTITAAIADLNLLGVSGAVTFSLTDAAYNSGETFPIVINQITGASAANTITIRPATGVTAAITGSTALSIFKLNGADFVTIDGSNSGSTDRSLSITNSNTGTSSAVVWIASATASDGANGNTIKNCVVRGNASTTTQAAINIGGPSAVSTVALTQNNSNTIQNNLIAKAQFGLWAGGTSVSVLDQSLNISSNAFGTSTAGDGFGAAGMQVQFVQNGTIDRNDVQSAAFYGINLIDIKTTTVSANKIHGITSGGQVFGLNSTAASFATAGTPSANMYLNNAVYDIRSTYSGVNWTLSGISNFGGYGDKYYFNSVSLTGQLNNNGTGDSAAAFCIGTKMLAATSTSGGFDIRNNVFSSTGSLPSFNAKQFAHFTTLTSYAGSTINNNLLYVSGLADIARVYNFAYYNTLANWQTASGQEANSISVDPGFASSTDLHVSPGSPVLGAAAAGTGVTIDFDGDPRDTPPDMGADEKIAPTPTPTNTATPTATSTNTATATSTATFTPTPVAVVSGTVTYGNPVTGANPRGVPGVLVNAAGSPPLSDTTTASGMYSLTGFGAGSYTLTPTKSGGQNSSITAFDAGRIAQYLTGNSSFTAAQTTVADVSGANGISSFDAALIARYAAALGSPTGNSGLWIFNPASSTHPSITTDITDDYAALLMGDVSGNWGDPSPFRPAFRGGLERGATVVVPNVQTDSGKETIIPINVQGVAGKDIISYEFDLRYDPMVIEPMKSLVDLTGTASRGFTFVTNTIEPGLLRVVVYGAFPIEENGVLLNLRFATVGTAGSSSPLTFERIIFNEGEPRAAVTNGLVELF